MRVSLKTIVGIPEIPHSDSLGHAGVSQVSPLVLTSKKLSRCKECISVWGFRAESLHYCITLGQPLNRKPLKREHLQQTEGGGKGCLGLNLKINSKIMKLSFKKSYTEGNFSYNYKYTILDWKTSHSFWGKNFKYLYNSTAFLGFVFYFYGQSYLKGHLYKSMQVSWVFSKASHNGW